MQRHTQHPAHSFRLSGSIHALVPPAPFPIIPPLETPRQHPVSTVFVRRILTLHRESQLPTVLPLRTPHSLQQPIPLRQPIQTIIALPATPNEPTQRIHLVLARVPAVLVDLADGDLHARVIFGFDDTVCGRALAGDVAENAQRELVAGK